MMTKNPLITAVAAGGLIALLAGAAPATSATDPAGGSPTASTTGAPATRPITGTVEPTDPALPPAALTAAVTYPVDDEGQPRLSGTGQEGATVRILDRDRQVVSDLAVVGGAWSADVPATLGTGSHELTVEQLIAGRLADSVQQTVVLGVADAAGDAAPAPAPASAPAPAPAPADGSGEERTPAPQAGVTVTNPSDTSAGYTPGKPFTFRGTATPGTTLTVQNVWGTVIATRAVDRDGTWAWTRTNMGTSIWQLEFIQDKNGPQQATATVYDFRPQVEQPRVSITAPADVSAGYAPDAPYTFRGTGAAAHTINVQNAWGTPLGRAIVDPDGTWQWTRVHMGSGEWHLEFVQDKGLASESSAKVSGFKPHSSPSPAVTATAPADPSIGYEVGKPFTFAGTATPGKRITVRNGYGTVIAGTPVGPDGTWTWTRQYMGTSIWNLQFVQDAGTPAEQFATVYGFGPRS